MKICSNCGATNSETEGATCRKCGALLPVARNNRRRRIEMPTNEENNFNSIDSTNVVSNNQSALSNNPEAKFFQSQRNVLQETRNELNLQDIPLTDVSMNNLIKEELNEIPQIDPQVSSRGVLKSEKPVIQKLPNESMISLPEIKPTPYQGSILSTSSSIGEITPSEMTSVKEPIIPKVKPLPTATTPKQIKSSQVNQDMTQIEIDSSIGNQTIQSMQKQKQIELEQDMTEVLKVLSKKLAFPENDKSIPDDTSKKEALEKKIQPSSLNEILKNLLKMNRHMEAAALLKRDGMILAAAISTRISDSLLATIAQNLTMIGTDIINGLSAGDLLSISIRGTQGILDLAPLDKNSSIVKDMLLITFSNVKARSGAIFFALRNVEKLIVEFLNGN